MKPKEDSITRIIAVDPGINITGYGILEDKKGEINVLAAGSIKNAPRTKSEQKLARIHHSLSQLIDSYLPQALILEDVFYHKNIRSTLKLGEVRGVCLLAAAQNEIPVFTYAARRVKKAVVGTGAAGKAQVQKMVQVILELEELPSPSDVADALALGITFFQDNVLEKGMINDQ